MTIANHIERCRNMLDFQTTLPLSLYIHLPWCIKKCPYCDFNSHAKDNIKDLEYAYIDALIKDIDSALPHIVGRPISSIFIGGGTPSLFSGQAIKKLMQALYKRLILFYNAEITIEVNPGTADIARFDAYRKSGINRISIGIQSFSDKKLKLLGRMHNSDEAIKAITIAKDVGFEKINIDLMYGLPEQTITQAIYDLEIAWQQDISHLSWYQLTIEPNTLFYAKPPSVPNDDLIWEIQKKGQIYLSSKNFKQYEISAYAKADQKNISHQCQHNLNYWEFGDYLGIGAGAHSKLTDLVAGKVKRYVRHRIPKSYIEKSMCTNSISEEKSLSKEELPLEFMMNALRIKKGFHPILFTERTGMALKQIQHYLEEAQKKSYITYDKTCIKPTEYGYQYLDEVLQFFMP